ncbi:MAG: glycosyl hydrolase family 18 protein [Eubacterium sp.]
MKKNIRYILLLTVIVSILMIGSGCDLFIKTNDDKVDLNWYMQLTYEDGNGNDQPYNTNTGGQVAAVALEDKYSEKYAIVKGEEAYVNIDTIKNNIDDRFYWDQNEKLILFTNAKNIYKLKIGETKLSGVSDEELDYEAVLIENEQCYINMKFVTKFIDMDYKVEQQDGATPAKVTLNYSNKEKTIMSTTKKIEMRTKGNYQNMVVTIVDKGTKVTVIETGKNWNKVRTDNGFIGFIPVKRLDDEGTEKADYKSDKDEYTHVTLNKKVSLVWNQIYNQTANNNFDELMANVSGVNVISPTWFSICDKRGNLSTLADFDYVEKAHGKGIQVWALVNDFTDKKLTKKVLTSTEIRQRLVKNIMYYIDSYSLDGVNIDFEYITQEIADSYLQFLRELSIECRKAGKILSIDNYVPSEWSEYYDREQQALLADYLIIMNYDEHTSGSEEAGSVSSMNYAENGIKDTIEQTGDASRVINGMPFYTRVWMETPEADSDKSGVFIEDAANGNYYLSSEAVGMNTAKKAYQDAGVKPVYDEKTGQNFVTYSKGKSTYMIWLEDKTSVKARLELMEKYELGGAAYWALGQESDSIWKTISGYFK